MLELRPGDYVACIDNRPHFPISTIMPDTDRLYTVEDIRFIAGGYSLRLNELGQRHWCTALRQLRRDARRFKRVYRPTPHQPSIQALLSTPKPRHRDQ